MSLNEHLLNMASYHIWAYQRLYLAIDNISETDYKKDFGLFFKSIHGTLNHLYLADCVWYGRFNNTTFAIKSLKDELIKDQQELKSAIFKQADLWVKFIQENHEHFPEQICYTNSSGKYITLPYQATLAHVFNHGTHHRGQISTIITQLGLDAPVIDFLYYLTDY